MPDVIMKDMIPDGRLNAELTNGIGAQIPVLMVLDDRLMIYFKQE